MERARASAQGHVRNEALKDLIKPAGEFQVWPREIEEVLLTHPAVADENVAGIKAADGERVTAQ